MLALKVKPGMISILAFQKQTNLKLIRRLSRSQDSITGSTGNWDCRSQMCVHLFPHLAAQWLLYKAVPVLCCQPSFNLIYHWNPFSRSHQHNRSSSFPQVLMSITHVTISTIPYIYICTTTLKTFNTKLYITWSRTLESTEKMHAERAHWSTKPVGYVILSLYFL